MKKNLIAITLLLIASATTIQAQFLKVVAKGGANVTKITGSSFDEKFTYGYHAGGFATIKLSKKIGLQPEVLFSQINTSTDSSFNTLYNSLINPNYVKNISLKYLTIPVVLNYNLHKRVALQGGVQYAKLIDGNKTLLRNGEEAFKSGDFSALAGIQVSVSRFVLSGRYLVGLNNINDIDNRDQWKNQNIQLSVGLKIF
jgi:hypothetical protein